MLAVQPAVNRDTKAGIAGRGSKNGRNVKRTFGKEGLAPLVESGV